MLNRQSTVWQILIPAVSIPVTTLPRVATTIKCSVQRPVEKQDVFRVKTAIKKVYSRSLKCVVHIMIF